jgi:retron-type reverse transcriptase
MTLREKISNTTRLTQAWKKIYSGKSDDVREHSRGVDDESLADFKKNEDNYIKEIAELLSQDKYQMSKLKAFLEPKKDGNFRLITAPCVRDRIVHAAILEVIQSSFPEIRNGSSYCLPQTNMRSEKVSSIDAFKMIIKQIKAGEFYLFESDIQSFFDKVIKKKLFEELTSSLDDQSINELLREIVYFEVANLNEFRHVHEEGKVKFPSADLGLSQGSPLSPLFANIYLIEFDKKIIKKYGQKYIRYVDDFIILCANSQEARAAFNLVSELLKVEKLALPPENQSGKSKTRIGLDLREGSEFVFLGIKVDKSALHPNITASEMIQHVDKKCFGIKKIKMSLEKKFKKKNIPVTRQLIQDTVDRKIQSKFGMYGYFHTQDLIKILNELIAKKSIQVKLKVKPIKVRKKQMPLITQSAWQAIFVEHSK